MRAPFTANRNQRTANPFAGFTLVELLTAVSILALILVLTSGVIGNMQRLWMLNHARVHQFREARDAFERITVSLGQATLNSYQAYIYNSTTRSTIPSTPSEHPLGRIRFSELQFICGPATALLGTGSGMVPGTQAVFFQAPLGVTENHEYRNLNQLLSGVGYFISFDSDTHFRPAHIKEERRRFRLMEYRLPSERNEVYSVAPGLWYSQAAAHSVTQKEASDPQRYTRPVADNIVALIISPRGRSVTPGTALTTEIAPAYAYDSQALANTTTQHPQGTQHLLPQEIVVTMIAIDETSAQRLSERYGNAQPPLIPATAFLNADRYEADLHALETSLRTNGVNYRLFTQTVVVRNALWELF